MRSLPLPAPLLDATLIGLSLVDAVHQGHTHHPLIRALPVLAALALSLRRRWPLLTFLLTIPAPLVSDASVATLVALYTLASVTRRRLLLAVCAATFTVCYTASWPSPEWTDLTGTNSLIELGYSFAIAAAAAFLGQLVQAWQDLSLRLDEISQAREHERLLIAQSVLAKERAELAREMHDVVSHQVSLIAVRAGALQVSTPDPEVKEAAADIRRLSVQTLDELRHMVSVLRAGGGRHPELTPQPSLADLEQLVSGSGIEAELKTDLPGDGLLPTVQRAVYRTVQEALTNVRKHAPGATAAVRIDCREGVVHATVTNTAATRPALPLPSAHHGLIGLRQRAELLGGTVTSGSTADGGYELRLELPVEGVSSPGGHVRNNTSTS
jgi:signal transduction histidine kinase